jgi:hypothetical protein
MMVGCGSYYVGFLCGRKICLGSTVECYLMLSRRLTLLISGNGI